MEELVNLRKIIDVLDDEIVALISERQLIATRIGEFKLKHKLPILDESREKFLKQYHSQLSTKHDLPLEFVANIFALILEESRKAQANVR